MKLKNMSVLLFPLLIGACGGSISQPPGSSTDPNADVYTYVDSTSQLGAQSRDYISDFIRSLPKDLQSANSNYFLADTSSKNVYSNRARAINAISIKDQERFSYAAFEPEIGGISQAAVGNGYKVNCSSGQTGAFVGQYTKGGDWQKMTTTIKIPMPVNLLDAGSQFQTGTYKKDKFGNLIRDQYGNPIPITGSEAYIYVGGWGGTAQGPNRRAIDAGLKHNVRSSIEPYANNYKKFFEDWDLFIKTEDKFVVSVNDDFLDNNIRSRFKSGQDIKLQFGVSQSPTTYKEYVYVTASGVDNFGNQVSIYVGINTTDPLNKMQSWTAGNKDLTFKRVISIAQTSSLIKEKVGNSADPNKSYWKDGSFIKNAAFLNTKLYDRNGTVYDMTSPYIYQGICAVSPNVTYAWSPNSLDLYANVNLTPDLPTRGASITFSDTPANYILPLSAP